MNCPDQPHIHADLECSCCFKEGEYIFVEALEALDCIYCGFEIQVPEERVASIRGGLEKQKKVKLMVISTPMSHSPLFDMLTQKPTDVKITPPPLDNMEMIDLYWNDADAYYSKYIEPKVPLQIRGSMKVYWDRFKPTREQVDAIRRKFLRLEDDERHGYSGA